jgi:hypothetical protein
MKLSSFDDVQDERAVALAAEVVAKNGTWGRGLETTDVHTPSDPRR